MFTIIRTKKLNILKICLNIMSEELKKESAENIRLWNLINKKNKPNYRHNVRDSKGRFVKPEPMTATEVLNRITKTGEKK